MSETDQEWLVQTQQLAQMQGARRHYEKLVAELQQNGFKWNAARGCWVHPDGTEIRED
jgi:hypothetical protein